MHFDYWYEGILFIGIFFVIIVIPCFFVAILGYQTITQMGYFPSKTPAIQMNIFWKLVLLEVLTFGFIMLFYRLFSVANK